jgi:hypothetical protein
LCRFSTGRFTRHESGINTLKDRIHSAQHRVKTVHGLLTSLMANRVALTPRAVWRRGGLDRNGISHHAPEDVAQAVVWLCFDAASFITGQVLTAEDGLTAQEGARGDSTS